MPKGKGALKATAVSLALTALQNEEVQRRLKVAGSEAFGRLRDWNRDHGPTIPDAATITGVTRRTTRQGRLELRLERLLDAEATLRAAGPSGPRLDWLSQTLAEADTVLTIAKSLHARQAASGAGHGRRLAVRDRGGAVRRGQAAGEAIRGLITRRH